MHSFRRVEIYKGHVIITNGKTYMRFWCARRFPSLIALKNDIDRAL